MGNLSSDFGRALAWVLIIKADYMVWLKKQEEWEYGELRRRDFGT